jgi:hypothetical protein
MRGVRKIVPANPRSPKILRKELLHTQAREQASEAESYLKASNCGAARGIVSANAEPSRPRRSRLLQRYCSR